MLPNALTDPVAEGRSDRVAVPKRFLMCPPDHFEVSYAINPWMDPSEAVDRDRALAQWQRLRDTYREFGHTVDTVPGEPGLPDMVFAANGGLSIGERAMSASFLHAERKPEGAAYRSWFEEQGYEQVVAASSVNEGEGDFLRVGDLMLAGTGFRTSVEAHHEVRQFFGLPVVSLELVDPRFYHLDTALFVLDSRTVAYYPPAFSDHSNRLLRQLFPDAVIGTAADAEVLGFNAVSDGHNVFITREALDMRRALRVRGYNPVGIDLSELLKAGGSVKCCTLEIHP